MFVGRGFDHLGKGFQDLLLSAVQILELLDVQFGERGGWHWYPPSVMTVFEAETPMQALIPLVRPRRARWARDVPSVYAMKTLLPLIVLLGAMACTPGEGRSAEKTSTDTVVTPTKTTDTTVVQKKVDVKVDTLKKTKHAPN
jgi:hypothetical protein